MKTHQVILLLLIVLQYAEGQNYNICSQFIRSKSSCESNVHCRYDDGAILPVPKCLPRPCSEIETIANINLISACNSAGIGIWCVLSDSGSKCSQRINGDYTKSCFAQTNYEGCQAPQDTSNYCEWKQITETGPSLCIPKTCSSILGIYDQACDIGGGASYYCRKGEIAGVSNCVDQAPDLTRPCYTGTKDWKDCLRPQDTALYCDISYLDQKFYCTPKLDCYEISVSQCDFGGEFGPDAQNYNLRCQLNKEQDSCEAYFPPKWNSCNFMKSKADCQRRYSTKLYCQWDQQRNPPCQAVDCTLLEDSILNGNQITHLCNDVRVLGSQCKKSGSRCILNDSYMACDSVWLWNNYDGCTFAKGAGKYCKWNSTPIYDWQSVKGQCENKSCAEITDSSLCEPGQVRGPDQLQSYGDRCKVDENNPSKCTKAVGDFRRICSEQKTEADCTDPLDTGFYCNWNGAETVSAKCTPKDCRQIAYQGIDACQEAVPYYAVQGGVNMLCNYEGGSTCNYKVNDPNEGQPCKDLLIYELCEGHYCTWNSNLKDVSCVNKSCVEITDSIYCKPQQVRGPDNANYFSRCKVDENDPAKCAKAVGDFRRICSEQKTEVDCTDPLDTGLYCAWNDQANMIPKCISIECKLIPTSGIDACQEVIPNYQEGKGGVSMICDLEGGSSCKDRATNIDGVCLEIKIYELCNKSIEAGTQCIWQNGGCIKKPSMGQIIDNLKNKNPETATMDDVEQLLKLKEHIAQNATELVDMISIHNQIISAATPDQYEDITIFVSNIIGQLGEDETVLKQAFKTVVSFVQTIYDSTIRPVEVISENTVFSVFNRHGTPSARRLLQDDRTTMTIPPLNGKRIGAALSFESGDHHIKDGSVTIVNPILFKVSNSQTPIAYVQFINSSKSEINVASTLVFTGLSGINSTTSKLGMVNPNTLAISDVTDIVCTTDQQCGGTINGNGAYFLVEKPIIDPDLLEALWPASLVQMMISFMIYI